MMTHETRTQPTPLAPHWSERLNLAVSRSQRSARRTHQHTPRKLRLSSVAGVRGSAHCAGPALVLIQILRARSTGCPSNMSTARARGRCPLRLAAIGNWLSEYLSVTAVARAGFVRCSTGDCAQLQARAGYALVPVGSEHVVDTGASGALVRAWLSRGHGQ